MVAAGENAWSHFSKLRITGASKIRNSSEKLGHTKKPRTMPGLFSATIRYQYLAMPGPPNL
jgi:hypothetical protein